VIKAGAVDATKIAFAMEGMSRKDFLGFDTTMRKDDHQLVSEYFVGVFKKGVKYDAEGTGLGWRTTGDHPRQGHRPAQQLQDEAAAGLIRTGRQRGGGRCAGPPPWKSSSSRSSTASSTACCCSCWRAG
jgi:hypothetical protein